MNKKGRQRTGKDCPCLVCKNNFYTPGWLLKRGGGKYCSTKCRGSQMRNWTFGRSFKRGHTPWNKGKKTGIRPPNYKGGLPNCKRCARRLSTYDAKFCTQHKGVSGKRSHLWKGGKTILSDKIRTSSIYKRWRKSIFERDDYICQVCFKRGGLLQVDHHPISFAKLIKINNINSLEDAINCEQLWSTSYNRTICIECHKQTDNYLWRGVNYLQ